MKNLLLVLMLCGVAVGQPNNNPNQLVLGANGPGGVVSVGINRVGLSGSSTYYYWVVANFPIGQGKISPYVQIDNAPDVLSGSNYLSISWGTVAGAISYDVLRTSTPNQPGTCTCAKSVGNTGSSYNDQGGAFAGYTYAPVGSETAHITLDNQGYNIPRLLIDTPINPTLFAGLPSAVGNSGLVYLVTDALTASNCGSSACNV